MTLDQALLFGLFAAILAMLVWGRFRHDLVAAGGLLIAVALGLVPQDAAFSGFSNPAVVIVALVLVASRAFENSGALGIITQWTADDTRPVGRHIAMTGGLAAALSAVINNVAALALLMPMDVQAARKAGRPPSMTLMALSFATILGGMTTLIGTPPNIIASAIREKQLGAPYHMFDFTPVGLAVALAGVAFVALIGWRLVPRRKDTAAELVSESSFEAELEVAKESPAVGRLVAEFEEEAENADVLLTGIIRNGKRFRRGARLYTIAPDDLLVVKGSSDAIAAFIKATDLQEAAPEKEKDEAADKPAPKRADEKESEENGEEEKERTHGPAIVEAVVRSDSYLVGRSAAWLRLRKRFALTLLGISHAGTVARAQVSNRAIEPGDVLLLAGSGAASAATLDSLGLIAINRISVAPFRTWNVAVTVGLFAAAIAAASFGLISFTVAIAIAVAAYAALGIVPAREFYTTIEWPVVVMLACLLPIGAAFDRVGGTALVAGTIGQMTEGHSPVIALVALMAATMMLSDVLNNVATMVITGPIAIDLAHRLNANPDTFLMGVAIAASCAFLTPIGHKNNTLIMGPGGFRFSDYWRMGLPLELAVLAVAVPMLLIVWPL
jgi:di/tricarboxylate transporter